MKLKSINNIFLLTVFICVPKHAEAKFLGVFHSDTGIVIGAVHGLVASRNNMNKNNKHEQISTGMFKLSYGAASMILLIAMIDLSNLQSMNRRGAAIGLGYSFRYLASAAVSFAALSAACSVLLGSE